MAKEIKTTQAELDAIFKRLERDYGALNEKQQAYAIREIGQVRGEISDMLADYANNKGKITRRRLSRLLRDLDEIEEYIREHGELALNSIIEQSSEWTVRNVNKAIGITLSTSSFDRINNYVVKYVVKRFGDDGLVLSDRIWGLSGEIRDELATVIRRDILKGESINKMIPNIRKVYENETWKIRRLARTESLMAHRAATSYNAQDSGVVKYVQFNDGTCGRRDHNTHKCYELAQKDPYGKGRGIYKPNDTEIWLPHPNCTSWVSYVLNERWL